MSARAALSPTCPGCGTVREPLLWGSAAGLRVYRCQDCGARWSVEGEELALPLGPIEPAALILTGGAAR